MRRLLYLILLISLLAALTNAQSTGSYLILSLNDAQSINRINRQNGTQTVSQIPHSNIYLISSASGTPQSLAATLSTDPAVVSAEVNNLIQLGGADLPPSSLSDTVASANIDGQTMTTFYGTNVLLSYAQQPALDVIHASSTRTISTGAGTLVSYIDTGVDSTHPALQPWLEPTINVIDGDTASEFGGLQQGMADLLDQGMADLLDPRFFFLLTQPAGAVLNSSGGNSVLPPAFGHGTMVAGLIHVVAPQARILPIKAFDAYGNTTMFQLIEGVYAAIEANADVLNMSFSTTQDSKAFRSALDQARAAGIVLIAAAGNDAVNASNRYPAAYTGVSGVAATNLDDTLASFSNYGGGVSLTAPGAMVVSTAPGGRYAVAWGTSFSAPIASGSVALVDSLRANGPSSAAMILNNADSIDALNPGFAKELGKGRVDVQQALKVKQ